MTNQNVIEITKQFTALERSVRRCKAALVASGIIVAAGVAGPAFLGAAKPPETISAKRFQVVDAKGNLRAEFGFEKDTVFLQLNGRSGKPLVTLVAGGGERFGRFVVPEAGWVAVTDETKARTILSPADVVLSGSSGTGSVSLVVGRDESSLTLYRGAPGKSASSGLSASDKYAGIQVVDPSGRLRGMLLASSGYTTLNLLDETGKTRATLGSADLKSPDTGSIEHRAESSLVLLREDGKVAWEAP